MIIDYISRLGYLIQTHIRKVSLEWMTFPICFRRVG